MRLTIIILESYLKTMSYVHCRQSFLKNLEGNRQKNAIAIKEVNEGTLRKFAMKMAKRVDKCIQ
jgi:hypothetical protein